MKTDKLNQTYVKFFVTYYILIILFAGYNLYAHFFSSNNLDQLINAGLPPSAYVVAGAASIIALFSIAIIYIVLKKKLSKTHMIYPFYNLFVFNILWVIIMPFLIASYIRDYNIVMQIFAKSTKIDVLFYLFDIGFALFMLLKLCWKDKND